MNRKPLILSSLLLAAVVINLDTTIVNVTLPSLVRQLHGPSSELVREPGAALNRACELAGRSGVVLATGSLYLVADLLRPARGRRASVL